MSFRHCWRGRWHLRELWNLQYCCEMIELADSWAWLVNSILSCAESVREVHSVLPFDVPVKSGSWIYFINMGIHLLMCSWKLCCVPDFGDFCSWKRNFGVGMYAYYNLPIFTSSQLLLFSWLILSVSFSRNAYYRLPVFTLSMLLLCSFWLLSVSYSRNAFFFFF